MPPVFWTGKPASVQVWTDFSFIASDSLKVLPLFLNVTNKSGARPRFRNWIRNR